MLEINNCLLFQLVWFHGRVPIANVDEDQTRITKTSIKVKIVNKKCVDLNVYFQKYINYTDTTHTVDTVAIHKEMFIFKKSLFLISLT